MTDRVVALIDMDCFYCQVETRLNPSLVGQPLAVIQYNQWKGGGIIAVNYEARDKGVTRSMRGDDAKQRCPDIILVSVPVVREKADLTRYRDAGREVLSILCRFSDCVQRASIDEAYIDLTKVVDERIKNISQLNAEKWKSTFVVGYSKTSSNDEEERSAGFKAWLEDTEAIGNTASLKLAVGALIVEEMREAVLHETGFKCSAGIAHNKILAKLACGLHKPNRQTILPLECVNELYKTLPVRKIKNLGGKFGEDIVEKLGCQTMIDLLKFSEKELQNKFDEKSGSWLFNIARGVDNEPVTSRLISKSIGCCKQFPGRTALSKTADIQHWLNKLSEELSERLLEDEAMNKRRANLLTVSLKAGTACSKSVPLTSYDVDRIVTIADQAVRKVCKVDPTTNIWFPPIHHLGLSAGKFSNSSNKIAKFFKVAENPDQHIKSFEEVQKVESDSCNDKKLSFFERIFDDALKSKKMLNIVPDFSKNDLYVDSEDSQSSLIKAVEENRETPDEKQKNTIKKNLFASESYCSKPNLKSHSNTEITSVNEGGAITNNENTPIKKKTIQNFFNKSSQQGGWTKLEELFPDVSEIDDELLKSLPLSYRTKVLKMRENCSKLVEENLSKNEEFNGTDNNIEDDQEVRSSNENYGPLQCKECGEKVWDYELHMDMHLAMRLDKELNSQTQVSLNRNTELKNVKENKRKVHTSGKKHPIKKAKNMKSIDMFFKK